MSDYEAVNLIKDVFGRLSNARSIEDLIRIENMRQFAKARIDIDTYPKLNFTITPEEVLLLEKSGVIDSDGQLLTSVLDKNSDPLTKVLYAALWKNGDLLKLQHIIRGVSSTTIGTNQVLPDNGVVFFQFGRHLSGKRGEPIIDQHVLRSFAIFSEPNIFNVKAWRELEIVDAKHHGLVSSYKNWLFSNDLQEELRQCPDYTYYIDRTLFATGKCVKVKRKKDKV